MPSDKKRRGKCTPKPKFHGNRYTKKAKIDCSETVELETVQSKPDVQIEPETSNVDESKPKVQATPSRSALKLYNKYGLSDNPVDSAEDGCDFCTDSDTDSRYSKVIFSVLKTISISV